jgi:hypothetical protein
MKQVAIITDRFRLTIKAIALSTLLLAVRSQINYYASKLFFPPDKSKCLDENIVNSWFK